jgi:hypothetical protein
MNSNNNMREEDAEQEFRCAKSSGRQGGDSVGAGQRLRRQLTAYLWPMSSTGEEDEEEERREGGGKGGGLGPWGRRDAALPLKGGREEDLFGGLCG